MGDKTKPATAPPIIHGYNPPPTLPNKIPKKYKSGYNPPPPGEAPKRPITPAPPPKEKE